MYRIYLRQKFYSALTSVSVPALCYRYQKLIVLTSYQYFENLCYVDYFYPFVSFSVDMFCGQIDRQTDGYWLNRLVFASWSRIYILVHYYFSYFTPLWPKLVYHFFIFGNGYQNLELFMTKWSFFLWKAFDLLTKY